MQPVSYARHQFPPEIIRHAVRLYLRFSLSYLDVEELLAERGIESTYESVRRWVLKFRPVFARNLRRQRPRPASTWHLDEMVFDPKCGLSTDQHAKSVTRKGADGSSFWTLITAWTSICGPSA